MYILILIINFTPPRRDLPPEIASLISGGASLRIILYCRSLELEDSRNQKVCSVTFEDYPRRTTYASSLDFLSCRVQYEYREHEFHAANCMLGRQIVCSARKLYARKPRYGNRYGRCMQAFERLC
jgi:hypothetical protein